jgi:hypothetical protein
MALRVANLDTPICPIVTCQSSFVQQPDDHLDRFFTGGRYIRQLNPIRISRGAMSIGEVEEVERHPAKTDRSGSLGSGGRRLEARDDPTQPYLVDRLDSLMR